MNTRHVTLDGWARWELIEGGRVVRGGEQHNLFLNQGLNQFATNQPRNIATYAVIGTGGAAPAVTDTRLGAEVARTNADPLAGSLTRRAGNGVYEVVSQREFIEGQGTGNLTEWGFSPASAAGANLAVRELFRDGQGNPVVVTKTATQRLRITYTLTFTLTPVTLTPVAPFDITGLGTFSGSHTLLRSTSTAETQWGDWNLFNWVASGSSGAAYCGGLTQADAAAISDYNTGTLNQLSYVVGVSNAYVANSYTRTLGATWPPTQGVGTWYGVGISLDLSNNGNTGNRAAYGLAFTAGQTIVKPNTHRLEIPTLMGFSWGRA